jgi:hypothetical protein
MRLLLIMFEIDQIEEVKCLVPGLSLVEEAGTSYLFLPGLVLPTGCKPEKVDALLCPTARDNYPSRLFFAEHIQCQKTLNWNAIGVRIAERNWHAFSWKIGGTNLRLAQMIMCHLSALQCN